jgi:diguanylate cyclase (GGDEF)-like protein
MRTGVSGSVRAGAPLRAAGPCAALAGVLLLVLGGIAPVSEWGAERLTRLGAESTADAFVRAVAADPDLLAPGAPGAAIRELGGLLRIRLFDADGRPSGWAEADDIPLDPAIVDRMAAGARPWVEKAEEAGPNLRAYATVAAGHGSTAIAELTLDGGEFRARAASVLWWSALTVLALAVMGFGPPLLGLLRKFSRAEARIRHLDAHEPLTGLLHRARFVAALDEAAALHGAQGLELAVLCLDLDGLREINEAEGHEAGDAVLRAVAAALKSAGPDILLARLGGDEFAVARLRSGSRAEAESLARSVLAAVRSAGPVTARIGVARLPADGDTAAALLRSADLALNRARALPEPGFVFFEREIEAALQARRDLEARLRETLARDAFDLHFQPLFDARRDRLVGFEALLRMPADAPGATGAGGFVSPAVFVPVAEEIGLISEIGGWVLRRACAVAAEWPPHLSVAVNLSPAQFREGGVHRTVREALQASGLSPERLELEITEGLVLGDDAGVMRELADLKALGVKIAMDDFGTGYSSLSYLWKFPFDKIKIDRSFMRAFAEADRNVANVIAAILSLSAALKMRVTAEGVETEAQAAFLKALGCDEVQGFFFGRPMPVADVAIVVLRDARTGMGAAEALGSAAA